MKSTCLILLFLSAFIQAQDIPPMSSKYLIDYYNIFSNNEEKELRNLLKQISKLKNDNICLLTVADYGSFENLDKFAYAVSNEWNLGPKGIIILMSKNKRRIRIETSSEIWSRLTDEECQYIIEHQIYRA
jgi:uncharacterized membrane protein YgcG